MTRASGRQGSWRRSLIAFCAMAIACFSLEASGEPATADADAAPAPSPTSIMTAAPVLTPVSDYGGENRSTAACALCSGKIGDFRQKLYDNGIAMDFGLTNVAQGVVSGGAGDKDWQYTGIADYQLSLDTDRLGLWPGGLIVLHARSKFGGNVLGDAGTISPINHAALTPRADEDTDSFIEEYYVFQALSEKVSVIAGRVLFSSIGDVNVFANNEKTQFLNTSLRNSPLLGIISSPQSIHGIAFNYTPTPNIVISPYLLSNSDVDGKNGAPGGGLFNDYSAGVQIATSWKIDDLPGHFSPIFGYTDKNAADLDNSHLLLDILEGISVTTKNDNWVAGFTFDQYIYVPSASKAASIPTADFAKEPEGIGVFMRFHYAPENRNPWNIALSGGLGGRGVIPGRPNDRYGLGFFALLESDDVEDNINEIVNLDDEWGMEVYYSLALTPWFTFGPSLQYVDSGEKANGDVFVVSTRAQINF